MNDKSGQEFLDLISDECTSPTCEVCQPWNENAVIDDGLPEKGAPYWSIEKADGRLIASTTNGDILQPLILQHDGKAFIAREGRYQYVSELTFHEKEQLGRDFKRMCRYRGWQYTPANLLSWLFAPHGYEVRG